MTNSIAITKTVTGVRYQIFREGKLEVGCAAIVPRVGSFMKEKMPEIMDFARAYPISGVITYENFQYWEKRMHIANQAFLKIFDFPLVVGNLSSFANPKNLLILRFKAELIEHHATKP